MSKPESSTSPSDREEKLGAVHEQLEGWVPGFASELEIREALEKAFDYRGDLTIMLKNGQKLEGYIFDRRSDGKSLADCFVRMMPKNQGDKLKIAYSDIAGLAFTGKDTAAGKTSRPG